MGRIKWKDFEVHDLIAIRGEINDEFTKTANKQGELVLFFYLFLTKLKCKTKLNTKNKRLYVGRMMRM